MIRKQLVLARHAKDGASGLGLWWTFAAALVAVGAIIVAIVQNGGHVRVHYLAWHVDVSLIVVVLTTALAAILLDQAGGLIWRRRRRSRLGRRSELAQLRAQQRLPEDVPGPAKQRSPSAEVAALPTRPAVPDI
jgi:uncharacterized integral membrane protein